MTDLPKTPEGDRPVADAPAGNWVDRRAPSGLRPYLRLSRVDRPIGTWLLYIPCLWGVTLAANADGFHAADLWLAAAMAVGALLMRGAGCTWNDITDRDIDAQVARTRLRPLPSGQVSLKQALAWMGLQLVLSAAILFSLNGAAIALGIAALVPVAVYPFAKRFTWWPQAFLGVAFNWGALLGSSAHSGALSWSAVLLFASGIAWTLFYDTIYAHQDREDDALIGVKSTARLFGATTRRWLMGFMMLATALMALAVIATFLPDRSPLALMVALAGVWAFGWHMAIQMHRLDIDNPASCLAVFRSNRDAGLLPALFLAVATFL